MKSIDAVILWGPEGTTSVAFKGNRKKVLEMVSLDLTMIFDRYSELWGKFPEKLPAGSAWQ